MSIKRKYIDILLLAFVAFSLTTAVVFFVGSAYNFAVVSDEALYGIVDEKVKDMDSPQRKYIDDYYFTGEIRSNGAKIGPVLRSDNLDQEVVVQW